MPHIPQQNNLRGKWHIPIDTHSTSAKDRNIVQYSNISSDFHEAFSLLKLGDYFLL